MQAKIGNLVRFDYKPLTVTEHYVGRLMAIRDTVQQPVQHPWYGGWRTTRSRYLITLSTPVGFRTFYTGSISNARRVGLFARIGLWLAGKHFEKFAAV